MTEGVVLPAERAGRPVSAELGVQRRQLEMAVKNGVWKTQPEPLTSMLGGHRVLRFKPREPSLAFILHFHGGGFRLGAPEMAGPFAAALANHCGVEVVLPQYRLAPEHPFPAGLVDARACLEALRQETGTAPLIVSGDSAGGGLAASLGVLAAAGKTAQMDGIFLLSPWLDLGVSSSSYAVNAASDPLFSQQAATIAADLYLQGTDPHHPLASPLRAPLNAFPPTLINIGSGEVLLDDAAGFHAKLAAIGARSELHVVKNMEHTAVIRNLKMPGAAETFAMITGFVELIKSSIRMTDMG